MSGTEALPATTRGRNGPKKLEDGSWQRAAREMRGEIVAHQLAHRFASFDRPGGMVRLQEYIRHLEESWVQVWLALEDIERCRAELAAGKRRDERLFVDVGGPRDVDEEAVGAECFKNRRPDDVPSCR